MSQITDVEIRLDLARAILVNPRAKLSAETIREALDELSVWVRTGQWPEAPASQLPAPAVQQQAEPVQPDPVVAQPAAQPAVPARDIAPGQSWASTDHQVLAAAADVSTTVELVPGTPKAAPRASSADTLLERLYRHLVKMIDDQVALGSNLQLAAAMGINPERISAVSLNLARLKDAGRIIVERRGNTTAAVRRVIIGGRATPWPPEAPIKPEAVKPVGTKPAVAAPKAPEPKPEPKPERKVEAKPEPVAKTVAERAGRALLPVFERLVAEGKPCGNNEELRLLTGLERAQHVTAGLSWLTIKGLISVQTRGNNSAGTLARQVTLLKTGKKTPWPIPANTVPVSHFRTVSPDEYPLPPKPGSRPKPKSAVDVRGDVEADLRRQIEERVAAGAVTKCPTVHAAGSTVVRGDMANLHSGLA